MRGIERLVAAFLLVGAVTGVALIPRFLAGPSSTSQVGLGPGGAAGPTVVHAVGLPPAQTARPGPNTSPLSGTVLGEAPFAVDQLTPATTKAHGPALGSAPARPHASGGLARSRVVKPDTAPLQQTPPATITIAAPPASSPTPSPAPPPAAPAPPSNPSPPSSPDPVTPEATPTTPPATPKSRGRDGAPGRGQPPGTPGDRERLPLASLHVLGQQDGDAAVQGLRAQTVQTAVSSQYQAGAPVVSPPLPSPGGDQGDGRSGRTGSSFGEPAVSGQSSHDQPSDGGSGAQPGGGQPPTGSWRGGYAVAAPSATGWNGGH